MPAPSFTVLAGAQRVAATSHAITLPSTANAGDLVVLLIGAKTANSVTISGISGLGATWTFRTNGFLTGSNTKAEIWTGVVVTPGTAITITPSASVAISYVPVIVAAGSYNVAAPVQNTSTTGGTSSGASSTTINMGDITALAINGTVFSIASMAATAAGTYSGLNPNFTQDYGPAGSATLHPIFVIHRSPALVGTQSITVVRSVAAAFGYAWIVIQGVDDPVYPYDRLRNAIYRM